MVVASALVCLALNLYHEARGEIIPGSYAVALVTMARAKNDPRQVCEQTFQRKQFSWTSGVERLSYGWRIPANMRPVDRESWRKAKRIAEVTLSGAMVDLTLGANHYHSVSVSPSWARRMTRTVQIGNHIFYRST